MRDGRGAECGEGVEGVQSARFQKEKAFPDAFEEVGLVFDEEDGLARCSETGETFGDAFAVFGTDAGDGFVQKEQARVHRCATGEGEKLLLAVGNLGCGLRGDFGEEELGQQTVGCKVVSDSAGAMEERWQQRPEKTFAGVLRQGEQHVLAHGEFADEPQVLKSPRHAEATDLKGGVAGEFDLAEADGAGGRMQETGDEIEQSGLARTVAAQQASNCTLTKLDAHPIQNRPTRKAERQLFNF